MKNYAILNTNVFLYDVLSDGRVCSDIYDLCKKGKLKLIYNDAIIDDYKDCFSNLTPDEKEKYNASIERLKSFGVKLEISEILNLKNDSESTIYKIVPSSAIYKDKSPKANNGLTIAGIDEIIELIWKKETLRSLLFKT